MMGSSPPPGPDPDTLVVRAVFVPEGQDPPDDFESSADTLRVPATYDPSTGELTCETDAGISGGVAATWLPEGQDGDDPLAG